MTTTNYSMCVLFICLFASCGTGEKRTDESIRIKVAEVEMSVPSSEREFSFISKPFKETELSFRVGGPIDRFEVYAGNYYQRGDIIAEIDSRDFRIVYQFLCVVIPFLDTSFFGIGFCLCTVATHYSYDFRMFYFLESRTTFRFGDFAATDESPFNYLFTHNCNTYCVCFNKAQR